MQTLSRADGGALSPRYLPPRWVSGFKQQETLLLLLLLRPLRRFQWTKWFLLAHRAGSSEIPRLGSSNLTHALIICPEKLAEPPIMVLHPVPPSSPPQITALITELFENRINPPSRILFSLLFGQEVVVFFLDKVFLFLSSVLTWTWLLRCGALTDN